MDTIRIDSGATRMVAHRGLSGIERENTNAAFIAAGNRSYFGMETDIYHTSDGKFVCIHNADTENVSGDKLVVEQTTYETLRAIRLLDKDGKRRADLRIPSLEEYVRTCKRYGKTGVLELKSLFTVEELGQIIDIIKSNDYLDHIVFIAFALENLLRLRTLLPQQPCQYLTVEYNAEILQTLVQHKLDLDIHHKALTQQNVDELHANGIKVNVWTVDDPEDGARYVKWGVDFITSNILE